MFSVYPIYIVSHTILVEVLFDDETIRKSYMDVRKQETSKQNENQLQLENYSKKKEKQNGYFAVEVLTSK